MTLRKLTHEMRVESEEEAQNYIQKFKNESAGLVTYKTAHKTKKLKGEIVDDYFILTITESFVE